MHTSTVQCSPLSANAALCPALTFKPFILVDPFFVISLCPLTTVPCSWLSFYASCFLSPLTLSGFSNGMLAVFKPEALNCFTFFHPNLLILSVSRNPILTHLPLSEFLDSLLCILIAPTPGVAFSLIMPHMLAVASSFLSGRAYLSLNFLSPLFA